MKADPVFVFFLFVFFTLSLLLLSSCSAASRPVENRLCQGPVPNTSQLCQVPCPIDCQVSPWGAWGPCTFENCEDQAGKKGELHLQQRLPNTLPSLLIFPVFSFLLVYSKVQLQSAAYLTLWHPDKYLVFFIPAHI